MKECNIVKDLLPLYIEELCSEDSKEYVETHLKNCERCKESFEYLKYSELCVEAVEKKEINAFKKLERYISGRIMVSYFLFLVVVVIGFGILLCTVPQAPKEIYYVLMPLTMLATGIAFHNVPFTEDESKKSRVWLVIQGILLVVSSLVVFYMICVVREDNIPFGIPAHKVGPMVNSILRTSIVVSLVILIMHLYQVGRKKVRYSMWCNLSILCIFLNLIHDNFLYTMSDPQTAIAYLVKNTAGILAVYAVMSLVIWVICERKKDK